MLNTLKITNTGPGDLDINFGKRLNLITGDNGLGQEFILDCAWWAMTRKFPSQTNPRPMTGARALPREAGKAGISFSFTDTKEYSGSYDRHQEAWTGARGRPANPGLAIYAMPNGAFAVWDPARNYWSTQGKTDTQTRPAAYVFSQEEVWGGLVDSNKTNVCNGLIRDLVGWQSENGETFKQFCDVLRELSPDNSSPLVPGKPRRTTIMDVRDIPTIKMPYGDEVPITHLDAGLKRVISMAYFMVWNWSEHQRAALMIDEPTTNQAVFLFSDIETGLHSKWQKHMVLGLLNATEALMPGADVQVLTTTNSEVVMESVDAYSDKNQDRLITLELVVAENEKGAKVEVKSQPFLRPFEVSEESNTTKKKASPKSR